MEDLINQHITVHYAFPKSRVENHDISIMRYIKPQIITEEWSGGKFIRGHTNFYQLYNEISSFAKYHFNRINEMFHQGDEMLTSIAIEKIKLNGWKIIDDRSLV